MTKPEVFIVDGARTPTTDDVGALKAVSAIPRDAQDCYALRSQQLTDAAWKAGRVVEEIVPVEIKTRKGVE
jgi:acetyl-CoA acetyltransferase